MYKFVKIEEYKARYKSSHPHARLSPDGNEAVISCNSHGGNCSCVSHAEAIAYIEKNWEKE